MSNEVDAVLIPVVVAEEALSDEDASDQDQEASEDSSSDGDASEAVAAYADADEQDSSCADSDDSSDLDGSDDVEFDNDLEGDSGDFFAMAFDPGQTCDGPPVIGCYGEGEDPPSKSLRSWSTNPSSIPDMLGIPTPPPAPSGFFTKPITIGPITVAPTHLLNVRGGDPKPHNPLVGLQLQVARRLKMRWYHASGSFMGKKVYRVPTIIVKGSRVSVLPGCTLQEPDTQVHSVRIQAFLKGKAVLPAQKLSLVALKEVLGAYWIFATTPY